MGLIGRIALATSLAALFGCTALNTATKKDVSPADRDAHNQTWYYDCCNPSLQPADKEMCKDAAVDADHVLWDADGNRYVFVWSDCEAGKEPWRKWENY